ncbi:alpha/beta hydrolase [Actinocorallia lasiicapitis]
MNRLASASAVLVAVAVVGGGASAASGAAPTAEGRAKPTVVLVHGAFSDGSSWSGVIRALHRHGYKTIAVANPLRDLKSDAAYVASVVKGVKGPVVLAGHSYGGAVITNAARSASNVKALVYVAAFAPDKGESTATISERFPSALGKALVPQPYLKPDGKQGTEFTIDPVKFRKVFAGDVPAARTVLMAAAQRPLSLDAVIGRSGAPAWRKLPAWFLVSTNDKAIPPAAQRFMAGRMHARTVEVAASHASPVSRARAVADLIRAAARSTG